MSERLQVKANVVLTRLPGSEKDAHELFHSYCSNVADYGNGVIQVKTDDLSHFLEVYTRKFEDGSGDCQHFKIASVYVCG